MWRLFRPLAPSPLKMLPLILFGAILSAALASAYTDTWHMYNDMEWYRECKAKRCQVTWVNGYEDCQQAPRNRSWVTTDR